MKESAPNLLNPYGIDSQTILRNASPAILYEEALLYETDSAVSDTGALIVSSSEKTGRSPKDKRIVTTPEFIDDIWWGDVNIGIDEDTFLIVRERAIDYLNICDRLYICLLYTSPSPRDKRQSRMPSSA